MTENFTLFQKFNNEDSAINFGRLMKEHNIEYLIENNSVNFDPILSNNEFGKEYCVKLKKDDFIRADTILSENAKAIIDELDNDYYLLTFSTEELIDVIEKSDEWNKFDVELAYKLLKEKGLDITEQQITEIKKQRIIELSKPEEGQNIYIIIGYIFAFLGGLLGVFIGWHLLTHKKTLPDGNRVYAYSKNDRKQGNRILIIASLFILFWLLYTVFKKM